MVIASIRTGEAWMWRFLPVSLLGGLIGSASRCNNQDVQEANFLILFATVLFLAQGAVRRLAVVGGTMLTQAASPGPAAMFSNLRWRSVVMLSARHRHLC